MYRDYLNSDYTGGGLSPSDIFSYPMTAAAGESPFRPEYEEYIRQYPGRGTLKIQISVARGAYPLKNVMVDVAQILNGVRYSLYNDVTDISGIVDNMVLPAKNIGSTLNYDESLTPEAEYIVTVFHPDFKEVTDCKVVIHDRIETILPISLVPKTGEDG